MSLRTIQSFRNFAVLCFGASLVAHTSLFFGFNPQITRPYLWLSLHLSIFVSIAGLVLAVRSTSPDRELWKTPATGFSWLLCILFVLFLFYALFNLLYSNLLVNWGYLTLDNGQVAIFNKGRLWKIPTAAELPIYQRYFARRSSGHWMVCHLLAALVLSIEQTLKLAARNKK